MFGKLESTTVRCNIALYFAVILNISRLFTCQLYGTYMFSIYVLYTRRFSNILSASGEEEGLTSPKLYIVAPLTSLDTLPVLNYRIS